MALVLDPDRILWLVTVKHDRTIDGYNASADPDRTGAAHDPPKAAIAWRRCRSDRVLPTRQDIVVEGRLRQAPDRCAAVVKRT
jgi:hypothetical protein